MLRLLRNLPAWWHRRAVERARAAIDPRCWPVAAGRLPLLAGLDPAARTRLHDLAALFLRTKTLEPAQGATLDPVLRVELALQACLPVLELGLDWYAGWHAVVLYPDAFVPAREVIDADGLVWIDDEPKSGEAWERGPVILSLSDAVAGRARDGYNVVLHEMAHKLDMRNGGANGHPPLHRGMSDARWAADLGAAYADLCRRADADPDPDTGADADPDTGARLPLDPYATESPAEFFAVLTETFFELPHLLRAEYPRVYEQFTNFYRQDPAARLTPVA